MSVDSARQRLSYLLRVIPPRLKEIHPAAFAQPMAPGKWSRKQVLGHLIDSAANNHQRFVRVQFEETPNILYDQNLWNACNHYQEMAPEHLVELWAVYNRHLARLMELIPEDKLQRTCRTNEPQPVTLAWLINDYVAHMEHHLHQLVEYY